MTRLLLPLLSISLLAAPGLLRAEGPAPATGAAPTTENEALKKRIQALEQKLDELSEKAEESELARILKEAEAESKAPEEQEDPAQRKFSWGALSLQQLNPEISVYGDFVSQLVLDGRTFYAGRDDRSSMPIRELGLSMQHMLDPYSMFKAALSFTPWPDAGVELEEVYISWFGLLRALSISVGRFRQNFGVVNRWHEHDLDQVSYPLALELTLGPGGLVGSGVSLKWFMPPIWAHANELTLELTDGENETLFAGEHFSVPTAMARLKSYYDLSQSTYLELGLSGAIGVNNRRGYVNQEAPDKLRDEPWRRTLLFGADLTLHWSPPQQARYRSFTWRSEYYYVHKQTPDDLADGLRQSWGLYSYVDYQLATSWFAGLRFDAALPTVRRSSGDTDIAWDLVPYLTFWQSEFVYLRLEYRHGQNLPYFLEDGELARRTDNRFLLQVNFAAGPHKHDKY